MNELFSLAFSFLFSEVYDDERNIYDCFIEYQLYIIKFFILCLQEGMMCDSVKVIKKVIKIAFQIFSLNIEKINKDEDDNLNKVEETNVKLPSLIKPKKTQFNPSNYGISINEFNSYALQQQLQVIKSKIISINSSTSISKNRIQFFKNIYKTLNYIIRLVNSPETSNYFLGIQTENLEDKFDNVCESNQVVFFYNATELLYEKELLESNEVREFFKLFKHVSIEIKYFSKSFRSIYDTVFEMSHVKNEYKKYEFIYSILYIFSL